MTNTFKFLVGGNQSRTQATDYTPYLIRGGYTKEFCNEQRFDAVLDNITNKTGSANADLQMNKNVFFCIYDGSSYWLLMKGVIEEVTWTSEKRCKITGRQSKRQTSGSDVQLHGLKAPQWSKRAELTIDDLITGTTWFGDAKAWKDNSEVDGGGYRPK